MSKINNVEYTKLFDNALENKIANDYQRELFKVAWDDFLADGETEKFISGINNLFEASTEELRHITQAKFILVVIQMGFQLLNKLNSGKLPNNLLKFDNSLVMLTAFNFIATLPYLLITDTCKSEQKCIEALGIINDFLGNHLFAIDNKDPASQIDCHNLYVQLALTLI